MTVTILQVATAIEYLKTYSALLISVLMFMTADYLLYKPNIIFLTVCSGVAYLLMIDAPSVQRLRVSTVDYFIDNSTYIYYITLTLF